MSLIYAVILIKITEINVLRRVWNKSSSFEQSKFWMYIVLNVTPIFSEMTTQ